MINTNKVQKQILVQIILKRPELEGTDGGNVGTDIISPQEGASDDKSDEHPVLPSNPPPNGKIFMYLKYVE